MRFRFCGDLDCPDWVLAQISNLSKLSSVKLKLLSNEIVNDIVEGNLKYEKVTSLTSTAKFDESDIRASSAALSLILTSSSKYNVESETLSNELQQLGLPKEHAAALSKVYADKADPLSSSLRRKSLRLNRLDNVEWKLRQEVTSDEFKLNIPLAVVDLDVNCNQTTRRHSLWVTQEKLSLLLSELKQANQLMDLS